MHRFYLPSLDFKNKQLTIDENRVVYQANKVLRMRSGHFFQIFDGTEEWLVQVELIDKRKLIVQKIQPLQNVAEPKLKVSLYQAIPKKPALFELIVQKATELGVMEIFPLITERTEGRKLLKFERLKTIAIEATEQCGRMKIPVIRHPVNYEEVLGKLSNGFIAYEYEGVKYLSDYQKEIAKAQEIQMIIGPEGGLSEKEINLAKENGIKSFSLGKRILRMETAAILAMGLVLVES